MNPAESSLPCRADFLDPLADAVAGKPPVPVNQGSSQVPSSCCVAVRYSMPRRTASRSHSPAAMSASKAHAVCDGRAGAPAGQGGVGVSSRNSRPSPPSSFWQPTSQSDGAADRLNAHVLAHRFQGGQDGPGAVDVVDAPATEPWAVRFLLAPKVLDGLPQGPSVRRVAEASQGLHDVGPSRPRLGGSIISPKSAKGISATARRVLSLSKAAQPPFLLWTPSIHSAPRLIASSCLRESSSRTRFRAMSTSAVSSISGYVLLANSKAHPPGGGVLGPDLPVAAGGDLRLHQPFARATQDGIVGRKAGVLQRDHGEARVPYRRHAGLDAHSIVILDGKALEALDALPHDGGDRRHIPRPSGR